MLIDLYPNKTHLIIDFDKTLFHLGLPWDIVFEPIKKQLLEWNPEYYRKYIDKEMRLSLVLNNYVKEFGDAAKHLLIQNNTRFEQEKLKGYEKNEDLINMVVQINDRQLYIWSSNTRPTITKILKENDLLDRFELLVTRTDVKFIKPNPEGFGQIYDPQISKDKYLMLGDSIHDQDACEQVGIDFHKIDYF